MAEKVETSVVFLECFFLSFTVVLGSTTYFCPIHTHAVAPL